MTSLLGMLGPATPRELVDFLPGVAASSLPPGIGGTPVNLLTRELLCRGQRIVLFTLDPALQREVILRGPLLTVCIGPWRTNHPARDFFAAERRWLLEAIRREQPAVLHAQWTYEYALAAQASRLPTVITAHDAPWNVLRHSLIPYRMARTLMAYRAMIRAPRIVAVAPYVARHLQRYMLYRGPNLVIPNGMPRSLFERKRTACVRAGNGITFASTLVGWSSYKNGEALIEAFAQVVQRHPAARLLLFGAGHGVGEPGELWARERGWSKGVEFVGQVGHGELLDRLCAEVDVLVHPALEEAQPMALIEAMALGIPVIAGRRSGGVPWTLDDGRAGILVDVSSPAEIAQAMLELAEDARAREDWGAKGHRFASERFHIAAVADAWQAQYGELEANGR